MKDVAGNLHGYFQGGVDRHLQSPGREGCKSFWSGCWYLVRKSGTGGDPRSCLIDSLGDSPGSLMFSLSGV